MYLDIKIFSHQISSLQAPETLFPSQAASDPARHRVAQLPATAPWPGATALSQEAGSIVMIGFLTYFSTPCIHHINLYIYIHTRSNMYIMYAIYDTIQLPNSSCKSGATLDGCRLWRVFQDLDEAHAGSISPNGPK